MGYTFRKIDCPVCNSDNYKFVGMRGGLYHQLKRGIPTRIVRCQTCKLLYPNPFPFPDKKQLQINYGSPDEYFKYHKDESGFLN